MVYKIIHLGIQLGMILERGWGGGRQCKCGKTDTQKLRLIVYKLGWMMVLLMLLLFVQGKPYCHDILALKLGQIFAFITF